MISLIVSHTYIIPIGKRRNGHLIVKPSDATSPPRKREPVSPMKTFAGFQFQQRKPHIAPRSDAARRPNPANLSENAITRNVTATVAVTEEQSPSIPSVRFTLFTQP